MIPIPSSIISIKQIAFPIMSKLRPRALILFPLLIALISNQLGVTSAKAATSFSITYKSTNVDWNLTIPNVGPEGLLTDTPYKLFITAKSISVPDFYNPKLNATGCQVTPLYESMPDEMSEPAVWNFVGYFGIQGPDGELLVEDPSLEVPQKLTDFFMQDVWADMQNKQYLKGSKANDRSKYYKLLSDGSVTRKIPVTIKFDNPGIYSMNINVITFQLVEPVAGSRGCGNDFSITPGFETENSVVNVPFGIVTDKSTVTEGANSQTISNDKLVRSCLAVNNELELLRFKLKDAISKSKKTSMLLISVLKNAPSNLKCTSTKKNGFDLEIKGKQKILALYKRTVNAAIVKAAK